MTCDFHVEIVRTDRTKSALINVENKIVKVTVPKSLSEQRVGALVKRRSVWIKQQLRIQAERNDSKLKEYVNGETFTYLGRNYRLKCPSKGSGEAKLKNGYFVVPTTAGLSGSNMEAVIRFSLEQWYRSSALAKLKEKTKRYSALLGVSPKSIKLKDYKARWGSCSSSGEVSYNWRIIIAPHHIVDYIVVHELCHLLEHNHGANYWKHVESIIPNFKECRGWLKSNGDSLRI